jgi:ABC-type uncharacterized transport system auxiliary subunit
MMQLRRLLSLACFPVLAACAGGPGPQPEVYFHIEPPQPKASGELSTSIVIEPFEAPGIYSERPLIWARGAALQQYYRHFWAEAPAIALQAALVDALRAGGASAVYTPADRARGQVHVRSRIRRLELQAEGERRAVLGLEFSISEGQRPPQLLQFNRERAVSGTAPEAYVAAIGQLAGEAFEELAAFLRQHR